MRLASYRCALRVLLACGAAPCALAQDPAPVGPEPATEAAPEITQGRDLADVQAPPADGAAQETAGGVPVEGPPEPDGEQAGDGAEEEELSGLSESDLQPEELRPPTQDPALVGPPPPPDPWYERWPGGARLEYDVVRDSKKQATFIGTLNGLLQLDSVHLPETTYDSALNESLEVRRARLVARGAYTGWLQASYMLQFGYDYPNFQVYDAFVAFHDDDRLRTLQVGYFRMPMTLSGRESGRDLIMMERPATINAFWPNRRLGAQVAYATTGRGVTVRGGVFTVGLDDGENNDSESPLQASGRITSLAWHTGSVRAPDSLVQVGASALFQISGSSDFRYSARPESRLVPTIVDTGEIDGSGAFTVGGEVAWRSGPVSLTAETLHTFVDATRTDLRFGGAYVTGSWILTGEKRGYDPNLATWSRLRPEYPLRQTDDWIGSLEATVHVSTLDLTDDGVDGGRMDIVGSGLNWYWNPAISFQVNLLHADVDGGPTPGDLTILQGRLQVVF